MGTNLTDDAWQDNLPGISTKAEIDEAEALGFLKVYQNLIQNLEASEPITCSLILEIHRLALGSIYSWAGTWRRDRPNVGVYLPPEAWKVPSLMAEFQETVNGRAEYVKNEQDLAELIAFAHHRLVWIHPFTNGNGRTARAVSDILANQFGFPQLELYHRQGDARAAYIRALQEMDAGNRTLFIELVLKSLNNTFR